MRKLYLFLFVSTLASSAFALTDTTTITKPKLDFGGFFRVEYWYDTRQNVEAIDGLFLLYPKAPMADANGEDILAAPGFNSLAMATRLRTSITMPNIFGAKSTILVEADFTGLSSNVHFRFRHALATLNWGKTKLMAGQTWHPMFVTDVYPYLVGLSTGAPFQSFNRSPQLTLTHEITPGLFGTISAIHQSDYKSFGPDPETPGKAIASSSFLRNSTIPNLFAQLQVKSSSVTAGLAADFKSLRPRLFTVSPADGTSKYVTSERINTLSGMAYLKVQADMLTIRTKVMYGQNLADHLMLGGYGVATVDAQTGAETYTSLRHLFAFANVTYGKDFQVGLFGGYAKNLGAQDNVVATTSIYGRGADIDYMFRVAPNIMYRKNQYLFAFEVEYTAAAYGAIDIANKAKVINSDLVGNTRFLFALQYDF
ncbi:MAG: hypothetical protein JW783_15420 [Bacteroidales bacterium]|nr:hypothetical protein [Bacteroidales bacterium]MBN2750368.1 hypothetical protein [Bacteroidales bacterium]